MRRFIVAHTDDYFSGGPSVGMGFIGDFNSLEQALDALSGKMGLCCAADILDTEERRVLTLVETLNHGAKDWALLPDT